MGSLLNATNPEQMRAYREIMAEMIAESAADLFTEMNVADTGHIYLVSGGYTVDLGSAKEIRAKMLTARGVLEYMKEYDMPSGSMDASVPGYVTFTPE